MITKLCPMRPYKTDPSPPKTDFSECIGDQCAWYKQGECAIKAIVEIAGNITRR